MRNNYFYKLIKYIKNVYHIENKISKLKDGRANPSYRTGNVMLPLLFGFLLRIQSLNELNCMLKENEFRKLFTRETKLPLVDTIRDTLKVIDLKGISNINKSIVKKAINNKTFRKGTSNLASASQNHYKISISPTFINVSNSAFFRLYFWEYIY